MTRIPLLVLAIASVLLTPRAATATADASLTQARELYASAAYDDALSMLDGLMSAGPAEERASVAMYRVLCLVALGRSSEVEAAIESLVVQHPLFRPPTEELSPRMRHAVTEVRRRLLPTVIQKRYADAKTVYDQGNFAAALIEFKWVLEAVADPDVAHVAGQSPLSDIKTLASGFRDLSEKALAPPPAAAVPVVVAAAPAPATPPARDYRRLYTPNDPDVVPPVIVRQGLPRFPGQLREAAAGVVEVIIDATGAVRDARLLEPVHPQYDQLALAAARKWQYQPARVDGVPVTYLKRVQVNLAPGP